jgi:hypothetical protein
MSIPSCILLSNDKNIIKVILLRENQMELEFYVIMVLKKNLFLKMEIFKEVLLIKKNKCCFIMKLYFLSLINKSF